MLKTRSYFSMWFRASGGCRREREGAKSHSGHPQNENRRLKNLETELMVLCKDCHALWLFFCTRYPLALRDKSNHLRCPHELDLGQRT